MCFGAALTVQAYKMQLSTTTSSLLNIVALVGHRAIETVMLINWGKYWVLYTLDGHLCWIQDNWQIHSLQMNSHWQAKWLRKSNFVSFSSQVVCTEGPDRIRELIAMGASFDHGGDGNLHLAREGGHSHRRIVHSADMTGREIERALLEAVVNDPNISMFQHHFAIDLLTSQVCFTLFLFLNCFCLWPYDCGFWHILSLWVTVLWKWGQALNAHTRRDFGVVP